MTPAQIIMVKRSWQQITPVAETASVLFYSRLLYLDPDIEALFQQDIEKQGFKLIKVISITIDQLDRFDTVLPILQTLGRQFAQYGISTEHYQTMGHAFLWMLQQILNKDFTPDLKQSWTKAYVLMARTMRDAIQSPAQAA